MNAGRRVERGVRPRAGLSRRASRSFRPWQIESEGYPARRAGPCIQTDSSRHGAAVMLAWDEEEGGWRWSVRKETVLQSCRFNTRPRPARSITGCSTMRGTSPHRRRAALPRGWSGDPRRVGPARKHSPLSVALTPIASDSCLAKRLFRMHIISPQTVWRGDVPQMRGSREEGGRAAKGGT